MNGSQFFEFLTKIQGLLQAGVPPKVLADLKKSLEGVTTDAKNADAFDGLTPEQRKALEARLLRIMQEVTGMGDGSLDETDIMAKQLASSRAVWILGFLAAASTLALILAVVSYWGDATRGTNACKGQNAFSNAAPPSVASPGSAGSQTQPATGANTSATPPAPSASATGQPAGGSTAGASAKTDQASSGASGGSDATAKGGNGGKGAGGQSPDKTSDKQPEVTPAQKALSTCESVPLKVPGYADSDITWPDVSTGSLGSDGVYAAPSSIAAQQSLNIVPMVKTANGQTQKAKGASIILTPPGGPEERYVLIMIILMGALGGCLHWLSGFAFFVGNREFLRSWIAYYLLMPLEGAALAIIVYLLLRVGILSPTSVGGQATSNLNTVGLYAFAGLTGIYSKQALVSLGDVFNVIFAKVKAKDESKSDGAKTDPKAGTTK